VALSASSIASKPGGGRLADKAELLVVRWSSLRGGVPEVSEKLQNVILGLDRSKRTNRYGTRRHDTRPGRAPRGETTAATMVEGNTNVEDTPAIVAKTGLDRGAAATLLWESAEYGAPPFVRNKP
jgi:hypothetical protein